MLAFARGGAGNNKGIIRGIPQKYKIRQEFYQ